MRGLLGQIFDAGPKDPRYEGRLWESEHEFWLTSKVPKIYGRPVYSKADYIRLWDKLADEPIGLRGFKLISDVGDIINGLSPHPVDKALAIIDALLKIPIDYGRQLADEIATVSLQLKEHKDLAKTRVSIDELTALIGMIGKYTQPQDSFEISRDLAMASYGLRDVASGSIDDYVRICDALYLGKDKKSNSKFVNTFITTVNSVYFTMNRDNIGIEEAVRQIEKLKSEIGREATVQEIGIVFEFNSFLTETYRKNHDASSLKIGAEMFEMFEEDTDGRVHDLLARAFEAFAGNNPLEYWFEPLVERGAKIVYNGSSEIPKDNSKRGNVIPFPKKPRK